MTTGLDQNMYIRVRQSLLLPLPVPTIPPTSLTDMGPPSTHLYLIEGTLHDISRYAGTTVDWLIKIAHLICAPSGGGRLYAHTTGTSHDWYHKDRETNWRQVIPGDPLLPGIYEFEMDSPVFPSQLSTRNFHSVTSLGSKPSASTFHQDVMLRDGTCVVSEASNFLIASRLIPKRMGTEGMKAVVERFAGAQAALGIHAFDPRIGILLFGGVCDMVGDYTLGFYHIMDNIYTLHNFDADYPNIRINGGSSPLFSSLPLIHLYRVALSVHDGDVPLPPEGIFNWHYLQCVVKRFAAPDYVALSNIYFHELPFKTLDEVSDEELELEDNAEMSETEY